MATMHPQQLSSFWSAREIAETAKRLGACSVPHSKRSVNRFAIKHGWRQNPKLARKRSAVGGGMEYHVSLFPEGFWIRVASESANYHSAIRAAKARGEDFATLRKLDDAFYTWRQKRDAFVRLRTIVVIERHQIANGKSRSQAVDFFVAAGRVSFSKSTLLRWFRLRDLAGVIALVPRFNPDLVGGVA